MKIFIDSADIDQIQEAFSWGICDGITTNPSLIKKAYTKVKESGESVSMHDYICRILETAGDTPVSLEVMGPDQEAMLRQGRFLYETFNKVADNVVVKVPVNPNVTLGGDNRYDGLKVIRALADEGIDVNTTLVFTPEQAWAAAKAGSAYVSPFAGRIDDLLRKQGQLGGDKTDYYPAEGRPCPDNPNERINNNGIVSGVHLVEQCVDILQLHEMDCEVLAASLRNPRQVRECALVGAEVSTIPFGVIKQMMEHQNTVDGMIAFNNDIVPEYRDLFDS